MKGGGVVGDPAKPGADPLADPVLTNQDGTNGFGTGMMLEALINAGSIGAGDRFQTAITVTGGPEQVTKVRTALDSGDAIITQNGTPVPYKVIATPAYAAAFAHDPKTTIYVETSVIPSSKRQVTLNVETPQAADGTPGTVVGSTSFLAQSRAGFFSDPSTGSVTVVVTGTETPWGTVPPQFELKPVEPTLATDAVPGIGSGTTPADGGSASGSTVLRVLTDAGIAVVSAGAGWYLGTLTNAKQPSGGAPANQPVPAGAVSNNGTTPTTLTNAVCGGAFTTSGHNTVPTGLTPTTNTYVITNVAGTTGVVMTTNAAWEGGKQPTPAAAVGDQVSVTVATPTGGASAGLIQIQIVESGVVVAVPPAVSMSNVAGGVLFTFQFPVFQFTDDNNLALVATDGTTSGPPAAIRTVVTAKPRTAAAATAQGGIVVIPFDVQGAGALEQWVVTPTSSSPSVAPIEAVVFGQGSGLFEAKFAGQLTGTADVRFPIRRVAGE